MEFTAVVLELNETDLIFLDLSSSKCALSMKEAATSGLSGARSTRPTPQTIGCSPWQKHEHGGAEDDGGRGGEKIVRAEPAHPHSLESPW